MTTDHGIGAQSGASGDLPGLLRDYQPGSSFYFASPRDTMLALGVDAMVPKTVACTPAAGLPGQVADFLVNASAFGRADPIVVGAVPFDDDLPAHLVLPTEVRRQERDAVLRSGGPEPIRCTMRPVPVPEEYERGVRRVLRRLERGELDKAVLARVLDVTALDRIDVRGLLHRLDVADPGGYTFALDLPRRGEDGPRDLFGPPTELGRTLLGASPELLVSQQGRRVRSNPLAGSLPRSADPAEDRERAHQLLRSSKDVREHAVVVEAITDALSPLCTDLDVSEDPSVVSTATMWHLSTEIIGELRDPSTTSLDVAMALHPTPAVCGTPVEAARSVIGENEPFRRGYYAGLVGWCDAHGDGEWAVVLRCAEVEQDLIRLYAGAGIVAGSDPAAELAETSAKFRTALAAMGLDERA